MKYYIVTFGCQMNRSDSERIAALLETLDYEPTSKMEKADLIVVNICSVRQSAVDRVYGLLPKFKEFKKKNKKLKTVLTGCFLKKDARKMDKYFDLILTIKSLPNWPRYLKEKNPLAIKDYFKIKPKYNSSFTALIPIMTGCNNFCTYCVVPYTRGRENSRPVKEIISEAEDLVKKGYKEIWLLGQNVNSYSPVPFSQLLKKVNDVPGKFWIRFTSSHPKDFSDGLIKTMSQSEKVTEYLNLPVQSGDDQILKRMNRPYNVEQYKEIVKKVKKEIPNISLSTDIIVGFPGETKEQFQNTVKLFKEIKYDMAYISKYSPRSGTAAAKLKDNVSPKEKDRREKILTELLKKTALEKNKGYIGKEVEVLIDQKKKNYLIGKTRTYKTVKIKTSKDLLGRFIKVKVEDALPWGLKGKI